MRHEELTIERLAKSGDGVAHVGGRTVFVQGALPGEKVTATVSEVGRVLRGEVTEWRVKSPDRRPPPCPLAGQCGGCDWLHFNEPAQRIQKEEILMSALEHLGGFNRQGLQVLPTVHGPSLGYRRRAVLHPIGRKLGFFGRGSHETVEVEHCPALTEPLQRLPVIVSEALGATMKDVAQVHLLESNGKVAISLHLKEGIRAALRDKAERLSRTGIGVVLVPQNGSQLETFGKPELIEGEVRLRPDAFAQANAGVNAKLVAAAVEGLALTGPQSVLELYSGNGNFTFSLARQASRVTAVEFSPVSVQLAQRSAANHKNIRFVQGDALKILEGLTRENAQFDRVLIDPPRTGAPGIGRLAAKLDPERLVYVACDPAALARDAEELFGQGFTPLTLQLFDLFPQTRHIEAVLVMER